MCKTGATRGEGRVKVRGVKGDRGKRWVRRGVGGGGSGSAWDTVCSTRAACVSHGHGVHCPEPRPQGHRPTEPIVPLLCSSTHFRRVLLLAMRVPSSPSTCIMRVRRWPRPPLCRVRTFGACSVLHAFQKKCDELMRNKNETPTIRDVKLKMLHQLALIYVYDN